MNWYYLQIFFITLCWIWGFNYTFKTGEIFGVIGDWGRRKFHDNVIKPIYDCPYCMSSLHGTAFYLYFLQSGVVLWVVFCFGLCGFVAITDKK